MSQAEEQARNQLANAEAHGNTDLAKAARKQLAALGIVDAAQKRARAADESAEARTAPPVGRATKAQARTNRT